MPKAARARITERMLASLKPVTKETWLMDSEVPGLGVRQRPGARPCWVVRFVVEATGKGRKYQIGPVGQVTLDSARAIAQQRLTEVKLTGDLSDRKLDEKRRQTVSDLIASVLEDMEEKGKAKTYIRDFKGQCRDYIEPHIGTMLVRDVERDDVERILRKVSAKKYLHNRVRSNLSKLFNEARKQKIRVDNPAFGTEKTQEEARIRVLDDQEVSRLIGALQASPCMEADAIRLLYLTGSRPKELLSSKWEDFAVPEEVTKPVIWTKPALTVKQRRTHVVQLSDLASATIRRMREEVPKAEEGDYVFPSRKGQGKHLTEYKDYWAKVAMDAGLEDARAYDLRKSFASRVLAATGGDVKVAMSLTGHTQVGVFMKHYAHLLEGAQGDALAKVKWV